VIPSFQRVKAVVFDAQPGSTLATTLKASGVDDIASHGDCASAAVSLDNDLIDVLFCDYDVAGDEGLDLIRGIRHRHRGRNPFVIVVATLAASDVATVKRLIDAGIDDLIRKPVSTARIAEGLRRFSLSRRPFVASLDYVGPTRRSATRDLADPSSLFHVPNTLHAKVTCNLVPAEIQRMVNQAVIDFEDRQLEARGSEIGALAERIRTVSRRPDGGADLAALLERMSLAATDAYQRATETPSSQLPNLIQLLLTMVARARGAAEPCSDHDIELLHKLAQAIRRAMTVEKGAVDLMRDIVHTVLHQEFGG